jgi:hypothetical protein
MDASTSFLWEHIQMWNPNGEKNKAGNMSKQNVQMIGYLVKIWIFQYINV